MEQGFKCRLFLTQRRISPITPELVGPGAVQRTSAGLPLPDKLHISVTVQIHINPPITPIRFQHGRHTERVHHRVGATGALLSCPSHLSALAAYRSPGGLLVPCLCCPGVYERLAVMRKKNVTPPSAFPRSQSPTDRCRYAGSESRSCGRLEHEQQGNTIETAASASLSG